MDQRHTSLAFADDVQRFHILMDRCARLIADRLDALQSLDGTIARSHERLAQSRKMLAHLTFHSRDDASS